MMVNGREDDSVDCTVAMDEVQWKNYNEAGVGLATSRSLCHKSVRGLEVTEGRLPV